MMRWDSPHRRSSDRLRIRRWAVLLVLAQVAVLVLTGYTVARSATTEVPSENLQTFAAIIRRPASGSWQFVAESTLLGHVRSGFTSISCNRTSGVLYVYFRYHEAGGLANIASAWSQADETQTARGILTGPSIGGGAMRLIFTRFTKDGPQRVNCNSSLLRGDNANYWIGVVGSPWS